MTRKIAKTKARHPCNRFTGEGPEYRGLGLVHLLKRKSIRTPALKAGYSVPMHGCKSANNVPLYMHKIYLRNIQKNNVSYNINISCLQSNIYFFANLRWLPFAPTFKPSAPSPF